jgi:hypothetical protein
MGEVTEDTVPGLALLGAGQFACTTYVPKLGDLAHLASLKVIWSRSKDAALKGLELAKPYAPEAEAKWGDEGLEAIWNDKTIHAVAVVLPAQAQLNVVLQALQAGKHVIQGANSIYNNMQCFCHLLAVFSIGNFVYCSGLFWVTLSL